MVGNYDMSNGTAANRHIIFVNGSAIINIVGNITSSQTSVQSSNHTATTLFVNAGNPTINITGNVTGSSVNSFIGNHQAIFCSTTTTLNITGNITTNSAPSIWFNTSGTLNLIGNATGGNAHPAVFNQVAPATIDILGTTTSGSGYTAIQGLPTTFVIIRGNVVHTDTYAAIYAGRIVINDNVTSWQFKDSTNTITRTLYTPGVALGNPATSNVRNGVTYGPALELTGTANIPIPANVRKGVPVDATIGTADLTAADMWNYLASNITTSGSIGKLIKDNLDVAVSTRLASTSYVAPDNADIAAIKAVTDTLTDVATETTSLAIKARTDLIPNNPASVDAVGAIVASYNV
jgi:hypothetical protein